VARCAGAVARVKNEGRRVVTDPQDLDGEPGPRLVSGQDQERYAAYLAVGIAGKCDGAEAAAALRDCRQRADRTGRPPDVGHLDRPARQDRRARRHLAGGRVQHKAEHRWCALERLGDGGVTIGQFVREVGDVIVIGVKAEIADEPGQGKPVRFRQQYVETDDARFGLRDFLQELRQHQPVPRPGSITR
jgi:hypothetical protein